MSLSPRPHATPSVRKTFTFLFFKNSFFFKKFLIPTARFGLYDNQEMIKLLSFVWLSFLLLSHLCASVSVTCVNIVC
jgi:hypothetical protein